ncbi:hypothetical protein RND71_040590 [Anisodus tanguticus]|uniref:FBD domain-containing protein n=1 Tax=Anisodus tanguticus TaxID=243964 RepID=A0AAE1UP26_9SOLA|nr:hypothetical protein RND71_040590 [Anisodus tanguticus]
MAVSLDFTFPDSENQNATLDYLSSIHRELYYSKSFEKIRKFSVWRLRYEERYAKDVDFGYILLLLKYYKFPQFAYKNSSLRELVLSRCQLNPCGSVNWSNLVSLSFEYMKLTDAVMAKVLSGCPNLECLELEYFSGIHCLKINFVKLRELTIQDYYDENLEILSPYIQHLEIFGKGSERRIEKRNVASLVNAIFRLNFDFEDQERDLEKECRYLMELLHGVAHVKYLELGTWCIEDLLSRYTNEDEQTRRFETHNFNGSFPHLKTIKIHNFYGSLSENKSVQSLIKYLLKHATVLDKFVLAASFLGSDMSLDYVKIAQEILSFPRSSPHASIVFSCR